MATSKLLTRSRFLRLAGAGVVAGSGLSTLAGCTVSTTPQQADDGGDSGENALNLYIFSDYVAPDTIPDFEKKTGAKVTADYYTTNEELLAKLQAGGSGYDIIVPSDSMVEIMRKLDLLMPLDRSKIPNFDNANQEFLGRSWDPENKYSVPYQWGSAGIIYDTDTVPEEQARSWDVLWNPRYEREMAMIDDGSVAFRAAFLRLGFEPNTTDSGELERAKNLLIEQKPLLRGYFVSSEAMDLMVSGELVASQIYSGDAYRAIAQNDKLKYVIPEEGSVFFVDNLAIPNSSPHPDVAHEFINYILEPEVGAKLSNFLAYGSPNEAALPKIKEEIREDPGFYPPPEVLETLAIVEDLGPEKNREIETAWTEVLSA